ncbi:hypothetical protein NDU88_004869 [Pleurodeles waltl]|uniref:Reverse transcriptase n=1 Tax=Pleurodeles waltl TaxID=8319 RepID=A0AAV7RJZ7_PLEWA|nr:hypothetical protein NDU88_004869 [Pleurodeles waltl]
MVKFLHKFDLPKRSAEERRVLDEPISQEDILAVIPSLKTAKLPRMDGLPTDFYYKYAGLVVDKLLEDYQESLRHSTLPPSFRKALIIMIYKPGKDPTSASA